MRRSLISVGVFSLILAYARQHRAITRAAEAMAHLDGMTVPSGTRVYAGT